MCDLRAFQCGRASTRSSEYKLSGDYHGRLVWSPATARSIDLGAYLEKSIVLCPASAGYGEEMALTGMPSE